MSITTFGNDCKQLDTVEIPSSLFVIVPLPVRQLPKVSALRSSWCECACDLGSWLHSSRETSPSISTSVQEDAQRKEDQHRSQACFHHATAAESAAATEHTSAFRLWAVGCRAHTELGGWGVGAQEPHVQWLQMGQCCARGLWAWLPQRVCSGAQALPGAVAQGYKDARPKG